MQDSTVILFIIKLCLGAFASFFAILLWAKTRNLPWAFIFLGTIIQYCAIVYDVLLSLDIIPVVFFPVLGIPVFTLIFTILPALFFIVGFIIMFVRSDRYGR